MKKDFFVKTTNIQKIKKIKVIMLTFLLHANLSMKKCKFKYYFKQF